MCCITQEQVNRLRYQERPNLDELRVHLLDINKHIDNFNEAFIEVRYDRFTWSVDSIYGEKASNNWSKSRLQVCQSSIQSHR